MSIILDIVGTAIADLAIFKGLRKLIGEGISQQEAQILYEKEARSFSDQKAALRQWIDSQKHH